MDTQLVPHMNFASNSNNMANNCLNLNANLCTTRNPKGLMHLYELNINSNKCSRAINNSFEQAMLSSVSEVYNSMAMYDKPGYVHNRKESLVAQEGSNHLNLFVSRGGGGGGGPQTFRGATKPRFNHTNRNNLNTSLEGDVTHRGKQNLCTLCRNNREPKAFYMNHRLRDENGKITCPVLMNYRCPRCATIGEHTIRYCPGPIDNSNNKNTNNICFKSRGKRGTNAGRNKWIVPAPKQQLENYLSKVYLQQNLQSGGGGDGDGLISSLETAEPTVPA